MRTQGFTLGCLLCAVVCYQLFSIADAIPFLVAEIATELIAGVALIRRIHAGTTAR